MRWIVAWNSSILICLDWGGSVRCGVAWRGAESRSGIARHSTAKHVTWHGMNSHNMARMHRNVYFIGSYVLSLLAIQGRKR